MIGMGMEVQPCGSHQAPHLQQASVASSRQVVSCFWAAQTQLLFSMVLFYLGRNSQADKKAHCGPYTKHLVTCRTWCLSQSCKHPSHTPLCPCTAQRGTEGGTHRRYSQARLVWNAASFCSTNLSQVLGVKDAVNTLLNLILICKYMCNSLLTKLLGRME